jgi:hypothetical protein
MSCELKKNQAPRFDDKRCLIKGQTDTLPWGHYSIGIERENFVKHLKNL